MQTLRPWLFAAALGATGACVYSLTGAAAQLGRLFDYVAEASAVADVAASTHSPVGRRAQLTANEPTRAAPVVATDAEASARSSLTGELESGQIMQLLEDELATETDPAAAHELLQAFGESLEAEEPTRPRER